MKTRRITVTEPKLFTEDRLRKFELWIGDEQNFSMLVERVLSEARKCSSDLTTALLSFDQDSPSIQRMITRLRVLMEIVEILHEIREQPTVFLKTVDTDNQSAVEVS